MRIDVRLSSLWSSNVKGQSAYMSRHFLISKCDNKSFPHECYSLYFHFVQWLPMASPIQLLHWISQRNWSVAISFPSSKIRNFMSIVNYALANIVIPSELVRNSSSRQKGNEIHELPFIIDLNISGTERRTPATSQHCYFLVKLAYECQMEKIFKRWEDVLVELVSSKPDNTFLDDLSFAQTYKLD